jgi:hypothetical protein
MTEPQLLERQRTLLRDLARLLGERRAAAVDSEADFQARNTAAEREYQETRKKIAARLEAEQGNAERELSQSRRAIELHCETEQAAAQQEFKATCDAIEHRFEAEKEEAEHKRDRKRFTISGLCEGKRQEAEAPFEEVKRRVAEGRIRSKAIRKEATEVIVRLRHGGGYTRYQAQPGKPGAPIDALRDMRKYLDAADARLDQLKALRLARVFQGKRPLYLLLFLLIASNAVVFVVDLLELSPALRGKLAFLGTAPVSLLIFASVAALLLDIALSVLLYGIARLQILSIFRSLARRLADADSAADRAEEVGERNYQAKLTELTKEEKLRDEQLAQVEEKYRINAATIASRRETELKQAKEKFPLLLTTFVQQRDAGLRQADEKQRRRVAEVKQWADATARQAEEKRRKILEESKQKHEKGYVALVRSWQQTVAQAVALTKELEQQSRQLCPAWDDPVWTNRTPPKSTPPALRFGDYQVTADTLAEGPPDERWKLPALTLPALLAFPQRASVLLRARDTGRQKAVQALQVLMLRYLTTLPPGKARFTIIDPVGLGENFAAFMHLADYDEALVTNRIWTEPDHIEQRLADLAAHMENVIQKYLRNQYKSIEEYNAAAGEVAEPFRVLVVANFPTNFSSESAKRLLSIAASGPSCGVFVLVSADTRQAMPDGFNIDDLEQSCVTVAWKEPRFIWKDADFTRFPLAIEAPPEAAVFNRLVHDVGAKAKDANRVEVSFDFIAPKAEAYWTQTSRAGVEVALGRAGATKRQHLRLGQGTAQHVLIAGKTGSGKSTLLHALITNLALNFGPDEIELYLVDFKKGVEFKTYANFEMPHARVIAIESEREFGLSVLQRLDLELRTRGERFRTLGVHDVKGYRDASGQKCARILLIVDEFQEFFTEDDKLAQEAALLLDRLVRQGRAFGLHILLGSQTLGGAYTLARSTIDQMAVRIALQCSEADANLILSKDNSAARLLSRPGEAIYNDQNGLLEGNDIFQVCWLPDERREILLERVQTMAQKRGFVPPRPQLVFEGNAPADVHKNHLLMQALEAPQWPASVSAANAWVGEAIAIKDPTLAVFRRQTSSNLLLLGQHDEGSLGILSTALVGLAAQHGNARFYVLDGSTADSTLAGVLKRVTEALPHESRVGGWREVPAFLTELNEEVERRQKTHDGDFPEVYLFLYGLHRFRDLRKQEDDFGFSRRGEEKANPAKQLDTLLKEGPGVGIHVLMWCDSLNNFNRALERAALREFEMRVLFQMSANDSSTLIDSPVASKLGMNRALFHNEDLALPEKFRPYSLPTEAWLAEVKELLGRKRLAQRTTATV